MGNLIPFFRYDLLARIIPGAFTLSALAYAGVEIPQPWAAIFEGDPSAGAIPGSAVVVPLIYAGVCYAVGVFYEIAFATPPLKCISDWVASTASRRAGKKRRDDLALVKAAKVAATKAEAPAATEEEKEAAKVAKVAAEPAERYEIWNALVHQDAKEGERFAHAHRFQAEAKMCLHSVIPAVVLVVVAWRAGRCSQQWWELILASVLFVVLCWGAYAREWRRWLQALIAKDHPPPTRSEAGRAANAGDGGSQVGGDIARTR